MPTESRILSSEKSYSPSRLMCPNSRRRGDVQGHGELPIWWGDVIDHLKIGRAAFYRYLPPDRIRTLRNQAKTAASNCVVLRTFE